MPDGALHGFRVVDVSSAVSGPLTSALLADHGAEVVLVEPVGRYDPIRITGPSVADMSGAWMALNRNKRAIAVNLRDARGLDVVFRLATSADVFVQNFRPGVIDRLGLGYADLADANPGLVYVSISGFGADGPYADQPVYDPVIQGFSGLAAVQGGTFVKTLVPDKVTAMTAAHAAMAALVARSRDGRGQHVEVNMLDSTVAFLWPDAMWNEALPDEAPVPTYTDWYAPYETSDGMIAAVWTTQEQFGRAVQALGRPELVGDPRFSTRAARVQNALAMREEFVAALAPFTTAEALARLRAADVPCGPIHDRCAVLVDPQLTHNQLLVEIDDPRIGRARIARPPTRMSRTPPSLRRPAPRYGEHTDEILHELGLSDEEIAVLRDASAVA